MRFSGAILLLTLCLISTIIPSSSIDCYIQCDKGDSDCDDNGFTSGTCLPEDMYKKCKSGPNPSDYGCLHLDYEQTCDKEPNCDPCDFDECNDPTKK